MQLCRACAEACPTADDGWGLQSPEGFALLSLPGATVLTAWAPCPPPVCIHTRAGSSLVVQVRCALNIESKCL